VVSVRVKLIDPRDAAGEIDSPDYRVVFFGEHGAAEELRVSGASSVDKVLAWAEANRGCRQRAVWVEVPDRDGVVLARLAGEDPNSAGPTSGKTYACL
jgi:hypothetical protein